MEELSRSYQNKSVIIKRMFVNFQNSRIKTRNFTQKMLRYHKKNNCNVSNFLDLKIAINIRSHFP